MDDEYLSQASQGFLKGWLTGSYLGHEGPRSDQSYGPKQCAVVSQFRIIDVFRAHRPRFLFMC